jgi:hypothetical protein
VRRLIYWFCGKRGKLKLKPILFFDYIFGFSEALRIDIPNIPIVTFHPLSEFMLLPKQQAII